MSAMVIYGIYNFEFSVSKDMENQNNNDKRRIPSHLIAYHLTVIVKELKTSVEHKWVVTTLNKMKH